MRCSGGCCADGQRCLGPMPAACQLSNVVPPTGSKGYLASAEDGLAMLLLQRDAGRGGRRDQFTPGGTALIHNHHLALCLNFECVAAASRTAGRGCSSVCQLQPVHSCSVELKELGQGFIFLL